MKTGVLVHGCHLEAYDWRGIVWGYPNAGDLGRAPKGVLVAHQEQAEMIVFGTGASERVVDRGGERIPMKEGEYTLDYLLRHFDELSEFPAFSKLDLPALRMQIEETAHAEVCSQNTREEVAEAAELFLASGVERMILVSSPTHISRCVRDAYTALERRRFAKLRHQLFATPSDSSYLGSRAEDVVIFEPPHRSDRHSAPIHINVSRILRIPPAELGGFLKRLDRMLQEEFRV
ncbi:MAG: hypothetical protein MK209_07465 [Planctomycetes bacterium]|nr:hypothetical protein [Planctomycetota bacterium]